MELVGKYFKKVTILGRLLTVQMDKFTFLYEDLPLFVPGDNLEAAKLRIKQIQARSKKKARTMY